MLASEVQSCRTGPHGPGVFKGSEPPSSRLRHSVRSAPIMSVQQNLRPSFGQGKTAKTILADQGDFVTVITDEPYFTNTRTQNKSAETERIIHPVRGTRAMHRSTLVIPTDPLNSTDYTTTVKAVSI